MATKKYSLFLDKFPMQLKAWKEQQKAEGKSGSQYDFARQVGVEPYYVTDWKTGRHGIPYTYIDKICEVLGITPDVYEPRTATEKYKYVSDYITKIGRDNISFANEKGLDLTLVEALTKIVDFDSQFPVYAPITSKGGSLEPEYTRMVNADSAPIDKKLEFLQVTKDGKRITLHRADLAFLKEVQDKIAEYVEFLFHKRTQEMKDEVIRFNEGLRKKLTNGGVAMIKPTKKYVESIDRFTKYDLEENNDSKKKGEGNHGKH